MSKPLGYSYTIQTTSLFAGRPIRQKFIQRKFYTNSWLEEMRKFANPWHASRKWKIELGFKLLAFARGELKRTYCSEPIDVGVGAWMEQYATTSAFLKQRARTRRRLG